MRLFDYIYENVVKDALNMDEPEVGGEYSDEYVRDKVAKLKTALSQAEKDSYVDDEAKNAVVTDIKDKLEKWQNVDKETKPVKTVPSEPPEGDEKEPPKDEKDDKKEPPKKEEKPDDEDDEDDEEKEVVKKKKVEIKTEQRLIKSKIRKIG